MYILPESDVQLWMFSTKILQIKISQMLGYPRILFREIFSLCGRFLATTETETEASSRLLQPSTHVLCRSHSSMLGLHCMIQNH